MTILLRNNHILYIINVVLIALVLFTFKIDSLGQETRRIVTRRMKFNEWVASNSDIIKLRDDGKNQALLFNGDTLIEAEDPIYFHDLVFSENKTCILLSIFEIGSLGANYSHLIAIKSLGKGSWKASQPILSKKRDDRTFWVSELGAISDDGTKILIKVGRQFEGFDESTGRKLSSMNYEWETWDIQKGIKLGNGLKIENGIVK